KAAVEPPGDHGAIGELPAEARRDGDPSLAVDRVPVLTREHRSRSLLTSNGGGWTDQPGAGSLPVGSSPAGGWVPPFHHFAPLRGIIARREGPSMGKSHGTAPLGGRAHPAGCARPERLAGGRAWGRGGRAPCRV